MGGQPEVRVLVLADPLGEQLAQGAAGTGRTGEQVQGDPAGTRVVVVPEPVPQQLAYPVVGEVPAQQTYRRAAYPVLRVVTAAAQQLRAYLGFVARPVQQRPGGRLEDPDVGVGTQPVQQQVADPPRPGVPAGQRLDRGPPGRVVPLVGGQPQQQRTRCLVQRPPTAEGLYGHQPHRGVRVLAGPFVQQPAQRLVDVELGDERLQRRQPYGAVVVGTGPLDQQHPAPGAPGGGQPGPRRDRQAGRLGQPGDEREPGPPVVGVAQRLVEQVLDSFGRGGEQDGGPGGERRTRAPAHPDPPPPVPVQVDLAPRPVGADHPYRRQDLGFDQLVGVAVLDGHAVLDEEDELS